MRGYDGSKGKREKFKWELDLLIMLFGKILGKADIEKTGKKPESKLNTFFTAGVALVGSVLIAQFLIGIIAQDIRVVDDELGYVVGQPSIWQILLGVVVAFGVSGFVVKQFLGASYIWPILASGVITAFSISTYAKKASLEHILGQWPAVFFSNTVVAILPVQVVAFGVIGAVIGYWLSIRYDYWRHHEI